ncbi:MAG: YfhO family protein [Clostridia bacterium]|nr:YfhO family protein [Clostridia bacterium]
MSFSKDKVAILGKKSGRGIFTFLIAAACAAAAFLPYIITSGGYFTLAGEFDSNIIPFYKSCHSALREGALYKVFGAYSFNVICSPFFLITLPFDNGVVPYLIGPLFILKFALAALTAYLYISRFTKHPLSASIGGIAYAFSGFAAVSLYYGTLFEAMILFPLLLLSLELLMTENRRGVFALCTAACAAVCPGGFFAMALFAAVYFFIRALSGALRPTVLRFLSLVFEGALGLFIAAAVLFPYINAAVLRTYDFPFGTDGIVYKNAGLYLKTAAAVFFPPASPQKPLFGASVSSDTLALWIPLFGIAGVLGYLNSRKGGWLKAITAAGVLILLIPVLNGVFSAFGSGFSARWLYMPILLFALMTAVSCEDPAADLGRGLLTAGILTAVLSAVIGLFPREENGYIVPGLFENSTEASGVRHYIIICAAALVCILGAALALPLKKHNLKYYLRVSVALVSVAAVIGTSVFIWSAKRTALSKETVVNHLIEEKLDLPDTGDCRTAVWSGAPNTGMYLGLDSTDVPLSVSTASLKEYYDFVGVTDTSNIDIPEVNSLLSVKYLISDKTLGDFQDSTGNPIMPGYTYLETEDVYRVYENNYYIGYGFSYDYYITYDLCEKLNGETRAKFMLKALLLTEEQAKKYSGILTDIRYAGSNAACFDLGADCAALAATAATGFKTEKNGFSAIVRRDAKSLVFFSVPYDPGWTATVNGKPAEIERVNCGFMAVAVDAGTSVIRFNFTPAGLDTGIYISLAALIVFLLYFIAVSIYFFRKKAVAYYPEGKELLDRWVKEDTPAEDEFYGGGQTLLDMLDDAPQDKTGSGFSVKTDLFDE